MSSDALLPKDRSINNNPKTINDFVALNLPVESKTV